MAAVPETLVRWEDGTRWLSCPKLGRSTKFLELWQRLPQLEWLYTEAEKDARVSICLGARWVNELWLAPYVAIGGYLAMVAWGKRRRLVDAKRRPGAPKAVLALWNLALAAFSLAGAVRTVPHIYANWRDFGLKWTVCTDPITATWGVGSTGLWVQWFVYSKFVELGDTVFMVLSNKEVPFIHWFHHAATLYFCWHSYVHESSYALYFVVMNYSVHAVMYGYFAGRAADVVPSWFPASMITVVQIAQMFVGVAVQIAAALLDSRDACPGIHRGSLAVGTLMYGTYLYLFADFFVRRLLRQGSRHKRPPASSVCGDDDAVACCSLVGHNEVVCAITTATALAAAGVAAIGGRWAINPGVLAQRVGAVATAWLALSWARQIYYSRVTFAAWASPAGTLPVVGNALAAGPAFMRYLLREAKRQGKGVFLFWPGGPKPIVVVATPKAAKKVLGEQAKFPKGPDYTSKFGRVFGAGLVTSTGEAHSRARRVLGKFFVKAAVEAHLPTMRAIADELAEAVLEPRLEGAASAVVDVQEYFHMVTLHIFCRTQLSLDVGKLGTIECPLSREGEFSYVRHCDAERFMPPGVVAHWMADEVSHGSNVIGTHILFDIPVSLLFPGVRRTVTSLAQFTKFLGRLVDDRRRRLESPSCPEDCLTALLREQRANASMPLSDREICQQIVTLISAGHDTTAYFCCYATLMLAKHSDIQSRLRAELADDDAFDWPTSLLKRVVQEVLRLYPVIPMVTRQCSTDTTLPAATGDELRVPQGTRLVVPFFALNRLPHLWGPDAAEFNPDRWLDANNRTPTEGIQFYKNGFMPFGYGSRTCIGYTLALLETRAILARLLARYEITPVPGFVPKIKAGVSLTVENPHGIKICFNRLKNI